VVSFAEWICEWLRLLHPFAVDQRIQASLLDAVLAKVQEGHRCWCRERSPKGQTNAIALRELREEKTRDLDSTDQQQKYFTKPARLPQNWLLTPFLFLY
jgi:hypothetical protein